MWEFFQGWQRKLALVTLMLACVFAAEWVRSRWKVDQLYYLADAQTLHVVYSCPQGIGWARFHELKAGPILDGERVGFVSIESMGTDCVNWVYPPPEPSQYDSSPLGLGLRMGSQFAETPSSLKELKFWIIPHGLIVMPLTLASCWLLLVSPRKVGSKTPAEPIPVAAR